MLLAGGKAYSCGPGGKVLLRAIELFGGGSYPDLLPTPSVRCLSCPAGEAGPGGLRSVCLVPLAGESGRSLGIFALGSPASAPFGGQVQHTLKLIGAQIASTISLQRKNAGVLEALERQKLIVDSMPALIAYWDREERCRFANKPYFEWFGYTPERLYGISMEQLLGETLYQKNKIYIEGAKQGIPQHFERELRRVVQGDIRHTQASYIPDVVNGEVLGFFVLVADVTERKRAEMEAIRAKEEAVHASQVKSRFLANMSHEIRTPVNGVMGMLAIALGTELSPVQRECLEAADNSARHLLWVVNDILDLSKIEAGEVTLVKKPFSLRQTIESALASALMLARRKGLSAEISFGEGLPEAVWGDPVRLLQVILNIFGNAVKFTASGRVELKVSGGAGDLVVFQVMDTGIGIAQDQFEKIFLPFSQVNESLSREFGGTGLGLSICQELVRLMGGKIEVESEVGKGSIFRFGLPLPQAEAPRSASREIWRRPAAPELAGQPKLKVLMAEDDPVCRRVQAFFLEQLSCEITHAFNGKDAVDLAKRTRYDLIFMDMQMPECDGIEATKRIRADDESACRDTPIIAITANAFQSDMRASLAAGMNGFVTKPIDREKLAEAVDSFLGRAAVN